MFIKNVYETACKETWSVATPFIAPDCSDHTGFFRQESVLLLHSRTSDFSAGTLDFFQTFLQSEHQLVGLLTGTSGNFSMKAPHLISIRPMEFDHVYCTVILARGHTSDSHLAIQFVDYCQCVCVCVISVWVCGASLLAPKPHPLLFLYSTIIPNPIWCCNNEGHGFFHWKENSSRCLINLFAFSGQNQAHSLTNMFHMNVLSNMPLYWARYNMC